MIGIMKQVQNNVIERGYITTEGRRRTKFNARRIFFNESIRKVKFAIRLLPRLAASGLETTAKTAIIFKQGFS